MTVTGIVLAGGRSTRMGQDKAMLPFVGETMIARAVRVVRNVADEVVVVTRPGCSYAGLPGRMVHDAAEDLGPLAGIAAGLAASNSDLNLIVACDMPLVRPAVLRRLLELRGDADVCVAVVQGHASPLCAVYRASVGAVAKQLLASGERRVTTLLDRVQTKRVDAAVFRDLDPDLETFLNCNTPDEFEKAALLARRAAL